MLAISNLYQLLTQNSIKQNGDLLCIYGDPAYPLRLQLQAPYMNAVDISHDKVLINTDVLCLTETQILPHQNTNCISEVLKNLFLFVTDHILK